ncbi:MAG: hypothetical protein M0P91_11945 [Sulfuricurvum sp.]|jgi:hypothetical protein|uniref:hypothetical protein n=1 Tax=Sulfuricurvum sp. TaxID=2025608 RepID=UPI0025DD0DB5|nr:hypothetical protein [Sulfuricurvum sp.]MCK9373899.1 hypothetical protein [Sulfuricurvum sp.]
MPHEAMGSISTLDDLFYYFEKLENAEVDSAGVELAIDDFLTHFRFMLVYNDTLGRLNGTIDAELATAIVEIQEFIYDLYKKIKYQDQDRPLSDEEKTALRVYVKISIGSTEEIVENLRDIAGVIFSGMTGKQKVIALTIIAMVFTGGYIGKSYIDYLESTKTAEIEAAGEHLETEARVEHSRLENARIDTIINGYNKVVHEINSRPQYVESIRMGQKAVLKPIKQNNSYTFKPSDNLEASKTFNQDNYIVDAEKAKRILKQKRNSSETEIVTDTYYIRSIEALEDRHSYRVKIVSSGSDIYGTIDFSSTDEDIDFDALSRHLSSRTALRLTVRTKTLNSITSIDKLIATISE